MGTLQPSIRRRRLTFLRSGGKAKATRIQCTRCKGKGWVNVNQMLGPGQVEDPTQTVEPHPDPDYRLGYLALLAPTAMVKARKSERRTGRYYTCHSHTLYHAFRCKKCKGKKTVSESKKVLPCHFINVACSTTYPLTQIEFTIKKGMADRTRITLSKQGDQVVCFFNSVYRSTLIRRQPGQETGDLIFALKLKDHKSFHTHGSNLMTVVHITLSEALTGFNRVLFTHLDGRGIRVASDGKKITRSQDLIKIAK